MIIAAIGSGDSGAFDCVATRCAAILLRMLGSLSLAATRFRLAISRAMAYFGFREDSFLMILAVVIGVVTAVAAVAFHKLIDVIRRALYADVAPHVGLYGKGIALLIVLPAVGGLL